MLKTDSHEVKGHAPPTPLPPPTKTTTTTMWKYRGTCPLRSTGAAKFWYSSIFTAQVAWTIEIGDAGYGIAGLLTESFYHTSLMA